MCKGINKSLEEFYTSQLELNADDLDRLMIEEEVDVFIQTVLMEIVEVQLIYLDFMDLCTEVRYLIFIQLIITEIEILQLSQFHQVFKKTTQMQLAILQTYFYVDNREIEQWFQLAYLLVDLYDFMVKFTRVELEINEIREIFDEIKTADLAFCKDKWFDEGKSDHYLKIHLKAAIGELDFTYSIAGTLQCEKVLHKMVGNSAIRYLQINILQVCPFVKQVYDLTVAVDIVIIGNWEMKLYCFIDVD